MKFAPLALLFLFAPSAWAAPVPKELRTNQKTEGTWEMLTIDSFGNRLNFAAGLHWSFDDKGFMASAPAAPPAPARPSTLQFTFHPEDKTVEYRSTNGQRVCPGLYKFHGDTLVICCSLKAGGERPQQIEANAATYVWTMKRVKENK